MDSKAADSAQNFKTAEKSAISKGVYLSIWNINMSTNYSLKRFWT